MYKHDVITMAQISPPPQVRSRDEMSLRSPHFLVDVQQSRFSRAGDEHAHHLARHIGMVLEPQLCLPASNVNAFGCGGPLSLACISIGNVRGTVAECAYGPLVSASWDQLVLAEIGSFGRG